MVLDTLQVCCFVFIESDNVLCYFLIPSYQNSGSVPEQKACF